MFKAITSWFRRTQPDTLPLTDGSKKAACCDPCKKYEDLQFWDWSKPACIEINPDRNFTCAHATWMLRINTLRLPHVYYASTGTIDPEVEKWLLLVALPRADQHATILDRHDY
ncbi:hypothetical protein J4E89_000427 [Alternaria sp. Ai002NY15]|nr:hypothetical protein J4E89_000427 [Alternaria sp. Ai002NY15]